MLQTPAVCQASATRPNAGCRRGYPTSRSKSAWVSLDGKGHFFYIKYVITNQVMQNKLSLITLKMVNKGFLKVRFFYITLHKTITLEHFIAAFFKDAQLF